MNSTPNSSEKLAPRSHLRTAGLVLVAVIAVYVSVVGTIRIFRSTLFPEVGHTSFTCRDGTRALYDAVKRARERTAALAKPERVALSIFRDEVKPMWQDFNAVRARCVKDADQTALSALRSIELLRYAEERAVRYQAIDLTRWRARAPRQIRALKKP